VTTTTTVSTQVEPRLFPRRPCVLFVDDNDDTLEAFTLYLRNEGMTVYTATNGEEALRLARTLRPDVVVLDVNMPVMDGLETLRAIRAGPET